MWWETLPTLTIIGVALGMPSVFVYYTNKLVLGNAYARRIYSFDEAHTYLRDMRLTGDPYIQNGLDCLDRSDLVEPEKKCECP